MTLARAVIIIAILEARAVAAPSAETLYAQGQDAFDHGAYAGAIAKWTESYALSGAPGLLFNLAQAQRLDGDCAHALSSYKRFIAADPDSTSEQHALAEGFVRELGPCGASTQTSPVDRSSTEPGRTLRVAGLAAGGAGIALLATGLLVGYHGHALGDEVTAACSASTGGCEWGAQEAKDAAGRRDVAAGYALDAVGAAAIAGGALLYYLGARERSIAVSLRPGERGAVVSWSGSW